MKYLVGTGAILFSQAGDSILLIQEHKAPDSWGIIGGKLEALPSVENLRKEIFEETGYRVTVDGLVRVYHRYDVVPQRVSFIYRATAHEPATAFDETEVIRSRWFKLDEVPWGNLRYEDNARMIRDAIDGTMYSASVIVSIAGAART